MTQYRLTPAAIDDLDVIWGFIAADSPDAADRVERAILATCETLADFPLSGSARPDLTELPVRFRTVPRFKNYVVVYRPETTPVEIIRVLHGMRDLRRLIQPGGS